MKELVMKKDEVRIGCTYSAKVSGSVVPVRITQEKWKGDKHTGWVGQNIETGRSVYIKSAQRLRAPVVGEEEQPPPTPKATKAPVPAVGPDVATSEPEAEPVGISAFAASPVPPRAASGGKTKKATAGQKKGPKPRAPKADKPMSALDAAAKILKDAGEPMRVKDIVEAAEKKGLWKSKAGKTPEATVYAAIIREIHDKGVDSRFVKKDRGLFTAA
jgi:hypothetical protein